MSTELAALDATESALLVSYEEVIRQGLESFVEERIADDTVDIA